jgi:hypothetical protein
MKLRPLAVTLAVLAALNVGAAWRARSRQARSSASAFVDGPLLDPSHLARAHRIVVREKPLTKVVHQDEGFQVTRVIDADAPIRESVLTRTKAGTWVVSSYFDLDADMEWVGRTMSDLSQGRLTRFLTSDPDLMSDLGFQGTLLRLEDEQGEVVREIEMGRKDGGDAYQVVRIGKRDAFVAKHEAEILGDPLAWIVTRVLSFQAADVRDLELPFLDPREPPLLLQRAERGAPLDPARERVPDARRVSERAEELLTKLLAEPLLLAVARTHPAVQAATTAARVRLTLFDGRRYEVGYGVAMPGKPEISPDVRNEDAIIMSIAGSHPDELAARYTARVALVYTRGGTLQRLPRDRDALVAGGSR